MIKMATVQGPSATLWLQCQCSLHEGMCPGKAGRLPIICLVNLNLCLFAFFKLALDLLVNIILLLVIFQLYSILYSYNNINTVSIVMQML